jgi:hypothetical protein
MAGPQDVKGQPTPPSQPGIRRSVTSAVEIRKTPRTSTSPTSGVDASKTSTSIPERSKGLLAVRGAGTQVGANGTGANLTTVSTSTSISPFTTVVTNSSSSTGGGFRNRSNSALPKLSTGGVSSHFHAPWKSSSGSRNGHKHSQSVTSPGVMSPKQGHHGAQSALFHGKGLLGGGIGSKPAAIATTSGATPVGSQVRLVPGPTDTVGVMATGNTSTGLGAGMVDLGKRISNRLQQTKTLESDGGITSAETTAKERELQNWAHSEMRERQLAELRNQEIHTVFQRISDVSTEAGSKLDQVYYSILEKMTLLKSTISGLQEVYDQARGLNTQFDGNSKALKKDIDEQVDQFEGFKEQAGQVTQLEERIRKSRLTMDVLSERLEKAREKVKTLETQEAEVQKSISCKSMPILCNMLKLTFEQFSSAWFSRLWHSWLSFRLDYS